MPRNRSRSRSRERRRSRSRSRERNSRRDPHKRNRSRSPRYRSRSPVGAGGPRRRSRSHSPRRRSQSPRRRSRSRERSADQKGHSSRSSKPQIDESQLKGMTEEEAEMMRTMGFAGFDTTKGKKVDNNNIYVAKLTQKRRYRQYMNRRGGFNRPLDFIA